MAIVREEEKASEIAFRAPHAEHDDEGVLPPTKQFMVDPETGAKLHWDYGSLTPEQLELSVPQCDQLCQMCQELARLIRTAVTSENMISYGIFPESSLLDFKFTHHGHLSKLRLSTLTGCHFCSQLEQIIPELLQDDLDQYSLSISFSRWAPDISLCAGQDPKEHLSYFFDIGFNEEFPVTLVYPSTSSPKVLDLAKKWLHNCRQNHDGCRILSPEKLIPEFLPTRLIEVKATDGVVVSARLSVGPATLGTVEYLTLSHCWGGVDIIKLTKATLKLFQADIPLKKLPKNFTDALSVTVHLGFRYIWIDSLCIVQDSIDDWKTESQKMGTIYRRSECTLAALRSPDSHGGLFAKRSNLWTAPCQLLGKDLHGPAIYASPFHAGLSDVMPLHQRGWVVQERCMSPRTLNFGDAQISWSCNSKTASEAHPSFDRLAWAESPDDLKDRFQLILSKPETCAESCSEHWIHDWRTIVREYTFCGLTLANDRLPAISGIIDRIRDVRRIEMLNGLWEPYLATEMTWCTLKVSTRLENEQPTWTWLSIADGVHYHFNGLSGFAESATRNCTVLSDTSINSGCVKDPAAYIERRLKVIGELKRVYWEDFASDGLPEKDYVYGTQPDRYYKLRGWGSYIAEAVSWIGQWYPDILPDQEWNLWAVQIGFDDFRTRTSRENPLETDDYDMASFGLVLKCVDKDKHVYQRVGYYELFTLKCRRPGAKCDGVGTSSSSINGEVGERQPRNHKVKAVHDCRDEIETSAESPKTPRCTHCKTDPGFLRQKYSLDPRLYEGLFGKRETIYLV